MNELFTDLLRLKQAMNGGELPPMTDIPLTAQDVIDPQFTIGLGALHEDPTRGLQCPVRGCGTYRHTLKRHLNTKHPEVGERGVKELLEIPQSVRLISASARTRMAAEVERRGPSFRRRFSFVASQPATLNKGKTRKGLHRLAGVRNLERVCAAQVRDRLIAFQSENGRSPSQRDAEAWPDMGAAFVQKVKRIYGSWNAAKERFGLDAYSNAGYSGQRRAVRRTNIQRAIVVEALAAYYEVHGTLPNIKQARSPVRAPLIPSAPTILKAMDTGNWPEAMRRVASLLNIYGGRYGLPEPTRRAS